MGVFRGKGAQEREQVRVAGEPVDPDHTAITAVAPSLDGVATVSLSFGGPSRADAAEPDDEPPADEPPADEPPADEIADSLRTWLHERRPDGPAPS